MTATEVETTVTAEQAVHADIYGMTSSELEKLKAKEEEQKKQPDQGGEICSICHVKGCRIGPMLRG